jgi:hypothetical protein
MDFIFRVHWRASDKIDDGLSSNVFTVSDTPDVRTAEQEIREAFGRSLVDVRHIGTV